MMWCFIIYIHYNNNSFFWVIHVGYIVGNIAEKMHHSLLFRAVHDFYQIAEGFNLLIDKWGV